MSLESINEAEFGRVENKTTQVRESMLLREGFEQPRFRWSRAPVQSEVKGSVDLLLQGSGAPNSLGKVLALFQDKRIIQNRESLQRSHSDVPLWGENRWIGTIQRIHERIGHAADDKTIDAAPSSPGTVHVKKRVVINRRMIVLEMELLDRRSSHRAIEVATDDEHGIVNDFRLQPDAIHSPEKTIIGIKFL